MHVVFEATVSGKGQVVIPKAMRDRLGITKGTILVFDEDAQGWRLRVLPKITPESINRSLIAGAGLAGYRGPALSAAEMRRCVRTKLIADNGSARA